MRKQDYSSVVLIVLKLNLDVKKLLKKIPKEHINSIISELGEEYVKLMLERLCEGKINYRELIWVDLMLKQGYPVPLGLRGGLESLEDQVMLMNDLQGKLELVELVGGSE